MWMPGVLVVQDPVATAKKRPSETLALTFRHENLLSKPAPCPKRMKKLKRMLFIPPSIVLAFDNIEMVSMVAELQNAYNVGVGVPSNQMHGSGGSTHNYHWSQFNPSHTCTCGSAPALP